MGGNERGVGKREDRKGKGVGWGEMKGGLGRVLGRERIERGNEWDGGK